MRFMFESQENEMPKFAAVPETLAGKAESSRAQIGRALAAVKIVPRTGGKDPGILADAGSLGTTRLVVSGE